MKKKLLQGGIIKGLLVGFICCLLLDSGIFVGQSLAVVPKGGKYSLQINGSDHITDCPVEDIFGRFYRYFCSLGLDANNAANIAHKAQEKAEQSGLHGPIYSTNTHIGSSKKRINVRCDVPWDEVAIGGADEGGNDGNTIIPDSVMSLLDSSAALNTAYLTSIDNLSKRMGDLRGGEESNIPWFRFSRNNNTMGAFGYNGNTYQVGYDREIARDKKSRQLLGISLDINDGTTKITNGRGEMDGVSVGVYYTKIYESGHYFDFILRQGRFTDEVKTFYADATNPYTAFDYGINATTLSGEYGYRWRFGKSGFYIEPQTELIWGYLSSANVTTNNNESLKLESNNKFISRLGLAFGKRKNHINYYARVSQFYDWGSAKSTVVQDGTASSVDLAKNWWEVSLGGGWHMSDISYFYAEISKQYKDIQNSLNFNLGFRFSL